jgi:hypothetical protein
MKKLIQLLTILLGVIGTVELVSAHEIAGAIGRKNSKAGGTDKYNVTCFDNNNGAPDHIFVQVFDTPRPRNPAKISIQAFLPATGAVSAISVAPNDKAFPSYSIKLVGGADLYEVDVTKSRSKKKGVEIYAITFHCQTANDVHTGTAEPELIQNQ